MARIPYPTALSSDLLQLIERLSSLNVHRMMAHSPPIFQPYAYLGASILTKSALDPALRELTILRVGVLCESEYEWHQHVTFARAVGLRDEAIEAVKSGTLDTLTDVERVAAAFAEEICLNGFVCAATFKYAETFFDHCQLVELVATCGYYYMTAAFLKTFDIETETTPSLGEIMAARLSGSPI
jgi:alkylhydroperoxidase family enzyme